MIGRSMVTSGFSARLALVVATLAFAPAGAGCMVADAAGLGDEQHEPGSALLEDGYGVESGSIDTEEQSLMTRRGSIPGYSEVAGPQPDPWRAGGPQPDPWNPGAPPPQDPPKPGNGKD